MQPFYRAAATAKHATYGHLVLQGKLEYPPVGDRNRWCVCEFVGLRLLATFAREQEAEFDARKRNGEFAAGD